MVAALATSLRRVDIRPPEALPRITDHDDVLVIPGLDAVYTADGKLIEDSRRVTVPADMPTAFDTLARVERGFGQYAPDRVTVPDDVARDDRHVLFIGASWEHYGHFIIDAMSRLWALPHCSADLPLLFLDRAGARYDGTAYAKTVVDAMELGPRLISMDRATLVRRMTIPEPAIQHAFRIYHALPTPHAAVARAVLRDGHDDFRGRPVYLSRSALGAGLRKSSAEAQLEDGVRKLGMAVVYPERLTLADQIVLFNTAGLIAGTIGSAFHTALFSTRAAELRMLMLTWEKINNRYPMIDAVVGARASYVNASAIGSKNTMERVVDVDLDVEASLDAIAAALAESSRS